MTDYEGAIKAFKESFEYNTINKLYNCIPGSYCIRDVKNETYYKPNCRYSELIKIYEDVLFHLGDELDFFTNDGDARHNEKGEIIW